MPGVTLCARRALRHAPHVPPPGIEREESLGHFEMLWDCPFCGTKKLLGVTHRHCPECGAPQDETRRYFPSDEEKVRVEDHRYVGADRSCPACQAPNAVTAKHCMRCGAPLEAAAEVKRIAATPAPARKPAGRAKKTRWWLFLVVLAVIFSLVYVMCLWKKTASMTVAGHGWERAVAIEEYRDVEREAWRDQLPRDARAVSCRRAQRSTRQVPDGEDCHVEKRDKGDGTYEEVQKCRPRTRSEPVDDDKCRYRTSEWTRVDEAVQRGQGLVQEPAWPVTRLSNAAQGPGARREGARRAVYSLELTDAGGGRKRCDVPEAVWRKYADGQAVQVQVKAVSGKLDCGDLR